MRLISNVAWLWVFLGGSYNSSATVLLQYEMVSEFKCTQCCLVVGFDICREKYI